MFTPRPAYRFLTKPTLPIYMGEIYDPPSSLGRNPPYGASVNYYLGAGPAESVQVEIVADGQTIRTLKGTKQEGINRVWWDLKYEDATAPRLRTSPVGRPDIALNAEGWRRFPLDSSLDLLVPPGKYAVRLTVGRTQLTRELEVRKDPNSQGSEEGIRAQMKVIAGARDDLKTMTDMIDRIELARKQLGDVKAALKDDVSSQPLVADADALDQKLLAVEETLFNPRITGSADAFYYPPRLYSKLQGFARGVTESDFEPTAAQLDVYAMFRQQVAEQKSKLDAIMANEVAAFNEKLRNTNLPHVGRKAPGPG
jgi:hypothetical protein